MSRVVQDAYTTITDEFKDLLRHDVKTFMRNEDCGFGFSGSLWVESGAKELVLRIINNPTFDKGEMLRSGLDQYKFWLDDWDKIHKRAQNVYIYQLLLSFSRFMTLLGTAPEECADIYAEIAQVIHAILKRDKQMHSSPVFASIRELFKASNIGILGAYLKREQKRPGLYSVRNLIAILRYIVTKEADLNCLIDNIDVIANFLKQTKTKPAIDRKRKFLWLLSDILDDLFGENPQLYSVMVKNPNCSKIWTLINEVGEGKDKNSVSPSKLMFILVEHADAKMIKKLVKKASDIKSRNRADAVHSFFELTQVFAIGRGQCEELLTLLNKKKKEFDEFMFTKIMAEMAPDVPSLDIIAPKYTALDWLTGSEQAMSLGVMIQQEAPLHMQLWFLQAVKYRLHGYPYLAHRLQNGIIKRVMEMVESAITTLTSHSNDENALKIVLAFCDIFTLESKEITTFICSGETNTKLTADHAFTLFFGNNIEAVTRFFDICNKLLTVSQNLRLDYMLSILLFWRTVMAAVNPLVPIVEANPGPKRLILALDVLRHLYEFQKQLIYRDHSAMIYLPSMVRVVIRWAACLTKSDKITAQQLIPIKKNCMKTIAVLSACTVFATEMEIEKEVACWAPITEKDLRAGEVVEEVFNIYEDFSQVYLKQHKMGDQKETKLKFVPKLTQVSVMNKFLARHADELEAWKLHDSYNGLQRFLRTTSKILMCADASMSVFVSTFAGVALTSIDQLINSLRQSFETKMDLLQFGHTTQWVNAMALCAQFAEMKENVRDNFDGFEGLAMIFVKRLWFDEPAQTDRCYIKTLCKYLKVLYNEEAPSNIAMRYSISGVLLTLALNIWIQDEEFIDEVLQTLGNIFMNFNIHSHSMSPSASSMDQRKMADSIISSYLPLIIRLQKFSKSSSASASVLRCITNICRENPQQSIITITHILTKANDEDKTAIYQMFTDMIKSGHIKFTESLFGKRLTENNFDALRNPKFISYSFYSAAIQYLVMNGIGDTAFDIMCRTYDEKLPGRYFFATWFRLCSTNKLNKHVVRCAIQGKAREFFTKFQLPTPFVYYLKRFHKLIKLQNLDMRMSLFDFFIKPLLRHPDLYGVDADREIKPEFMNEIYGRRDMANVINQVNQMIELPAAITAVVTERDTMILSHVFDEVPVPMSLNNLESTVDLSYTDATAIRDSGAFVNIDIDNTAKTNWMISLAKFKTAVPDLLVAYIQQSVGLSTDDIYLWVDMSDATTKSMAIFNVTLDRLPEDIKARIKKLKFLFIPHGYGLILSENLRSNAKLAEFPDDLENDPDCKSVVLPNRPTKCELAANMIPRSDESPRIYTFNGWFEIRHIERVNGIPIKTYLRIGADEVETVKVEGEKLVISYVHDGNTKTYEIATVLAERIQIGIRQMVKRNKNIESDNRVISEGISNEVFLASMAYNDACPKEGRRNTGAIEMLQRTTEILAGKIVYTTNIFEILETLPLNGTMAHVMSFRENNIARLNFENALKFMRGAINSSNSKRETVWGILTQLVNTYIREEPIRRMLEVVVWSKITSPESSYMAMQIMTESIEDVTVWGSAIGHLAKANMGGVCEFIVDRLMTGRLVGFDIYDWNEKFAIVDVAYVASKAMAPVIRKNLPGFLFACLIGAIRSENKNFYEAIGDILDSQRNAEMFEVLSNLKEEVHAFSICHVGRKFFQKFTDHATFSLIEQKFMTLNSNENGVLCILNPRANIASVCYELEKVLLDERNTRMLECCLHTLHSRTVDIESSKKTFWIALTMIMGQQYAKHGFEILCQGARFGFNIGADAGGAILKAVAHLGASMNVDFIRSFPRAIVSVMLPWCMDDQMAQYALYVIKGLYQLYYNDSMNLVYFALAVATFAQDSDLQALGINDRNFQSFIMLGFDKRNDDSFFWIAGYLYWALQLRSVNRRRKEILLSGLQSLLLRNQKLVYATRRQFNGLCEYLFMEHGNTGCLEEYITSIKGTLARDRQEERYQEIPLSKPVPTKQSPDTLKPMMLNALAVVRGWVQTL